MKPFKFYEARSFPELSLSKPMISSKVQKSLFFSERESVVTDLKLVKPQHLGLLDLMIVESGVWRNINGYIRYPINGRAERIDVTGYIRPVKIELYYDRTRKMVILQAAKKICRGVTENLKNSEMGVDIVDKFVNINKVCSICPRFSAVTFRDLSAYMTSATVYGNQL